MEIDVEVVKKNIDTVFNKLDNNMDGFVTREEFVEACIQVVAGTAEPRSQLETG